MAMLTQHLHFSSSSAFPNSREKRGGRPPFFFLFFVVLLCPFFGSSFFFLHDAASPWWSSHITVQATKLRAASSADSREAKSPVSLPPPLIRVSEGALPPGASSSSSAGASYTPFSFPPSLPTILQGSASSPLEGVTHQSIVQPEIPPANNPKGSAAAVSTVLASPPAPGTLNTTLLSPQPPSPSASSLFLSGNSNNVGTTSVLPVQLSSPSSPDSSDRSSGVLRATTPLTFSATPVVGGAQTPPAASPSSSSLPFQASSVVLTSNGFNGGSPQQQQQIQQQEQEQQRSLSSSSLGASSSSGNTVNNTPGVSTPVPVVTVAPSPLPLPTGADNLVHLPPPLIVSPSSSSLPPGNDNANSERAGKPSSSSSPPSSFLPRGEGEREEANQGSPSSSTAGDILVSPLNPLPSAFSPSSSSSGEQQQQEQEQHQGASLPQQEDVSSASSSSVEAGGVYTPGVPSSLVLPSTSGSLVESVLVESRSSAPRHSSLVWSWLLSPLALIPAFVASRVLWLMKVFAVLSAILMQLSPLPTIMRIKACRSTADLQGLPYVMLLLSAVVWLAYGMLKLDVVVLVPNITGVLLSTWYVRVFIRYCKNEEQNKAMRIFIGSSLFLLASLLLIFLVLGLEQGTRLIGLSAGKVKARLIIQYIPTTVTVTKSNNCTTLSLSVPTCHL